MNPSRTTRLTSLHCHKAPAPSYALTLTLNTGQEYTTAKEANNFHPRQTSCSYTSPHSSSVQFTLIRSLFSQRRFPDHRRPTIHPTPHCPSQPGPLTHQIPSTRKALQEDDLQPTHLLPGLDGESWTKSCLLGSERPEPEPAPSPPKFRNSGDGGSEGLQPLRTMASRETETLNKTRFLHFRWGSPFSVPGTLLPSA